MNEILKALLGAAEGAGYVLDTPGALLRGVLAGRPGTRATGRDVLEEHGLTGSNDDQGWVPDAGDIGGFVLENALDPMNLIGGGLIKGILGKAKLARASNTKSLIDRARRFMPQEIVDKLHPSMLEAPGKPRTLHHGTWLSELDASHLDPAFAGRSTDPGFFGKGTYFTLDKDRANSFAQAYANDEPSGAVIKAFADVRNPFHVDPGRSGEEFYQQMDEMGMGGFGFLEDQSELTDALKRRGYDAAMPERFLPGSYDEAGKLHQAGLGEWPNDELNVFDKSQIYLPYIAAALQKEPKASPLLAALLGHNAAVNTHRVME